MTEETYIFGIPVPSTDKVFLSVVVVHILLGILSVITGLAAMFANKTSIIHKRFGAMYYWLMAASFVTIVVMSFMRWPHNIHLLMIGTLSFGFTYTGRQIARSRHRNWTRSHTICMGLSYVFLLTGFYVDNGRHLPFWSMFPQWSFYILPSLIGIPIIIRTLLKHPLNGRAGHSDQ